MITKWEEIQYRCIQGIFQKLPSLNQVELRDFFAMQSMNGILASGKVYDAKEVADLSYMIADAMLEAREKTRKQGGENA